MPPSGAPREPRRAAARDRARAAPGPPKPSLRSGGGTREQRVSAARAPRATPGEGVGAGDHEGARHAGSQIERRQLLRGPAVVENEWCGSLEFEELQDGCGYSGEWIVKGLPASMEVTDNVFFITQKENVARVQFESDRYGEVDFDAVFDSRTLARAAGTMSLQASGNPSLRFDITFTVTEFAGWDEFKGTWKQTLPTGGLSGEWCAYRSGGEPPC